MEKSGSIGESYLEYAQSFLSFFIDPNARLFGVYILTSLLIAYILFRKQKTETHFRQFLFPKSVWQHPSAWLDLRYFFFHGLIGHFVVYALVAGAFVTGLSLTINVEQLESLTPAADYNSAYRWTIAVIALITFTVLSDFIGYVLHYLQHKVPVLWQFHKVHHSGEVMHPLSNFREHPVDNLVYDFTIQFINGAAWGVVLGLIGFRPDAISILGISIFALAFNLLGYQLRHSHIWLKWPGKWSKVFPSPAHHHVHHSRHPDHLDKNFAFMLPLWDVIFKTYEMPEDNRNVEFGIVEDSSDLNSCLNLYIIPFRDAYRVLKTPENKDAAKPVTME